MLIKHFYRTPTDQCKFKILTYSFEIDPNSTDQERMITTGEDSAGNYVGSFSIESKDKRGGFIVVKLSKSELQAALEKIKQREAEGN